MTERIRKEVAAVLADINRLVEKDFMEYQKQVEALKFSLFKAYKPVGVD
jgi:hypothetical protein